MEEFLKIAQPFISAFDQIRAMKRPQNYILLKYTFFNNILRRNFRRLMKLQRLDKKCEM